MELSDNFIRYVMRRLDEINCKLDALEKLQTEKRIEVVDCSVEFEYRDGRMLRVPARKGEQE